jgi:hypothetical protein
MPCEPSHIYLFVLVTVGGGAWGIYPQGAGTRPVVLVCDNTMTTRVALAFDEFGDAGAHPRRFMQEALPRIIEERPFIHVLREDMPFCQLMHHRGHTPSIGTAVGPLLRQLGVGSRSRTQHETYGNQCADDSLQTHGLSPCSEVG